MPAQHVELGDRQRVHPVEADGVAQRDQVHPAAAPAAAGGGAELVAALDHPLADLVVQLGREGPGADPGRVGLGDPPDLVMSVGPTPAPTHGGAGDRVGGGDEGIGAVVEVEQGRLGALEDHRLAAVERVPAELRGVGDVGLEPVAEVDVFLDHRVQVEARVRHARRSALRRRFGLLAGFLALLCAAAPRARAAPAAWAPARRGSWSAGSSRRAGPGRGCRAAAPCRRRQGPMPRRVVPIESLPSLVSPGCVEQHVVGHDQVRVGGDAEVADARCRPRLSPSISPSSTRGSRTTPLPITQVFSGVEDARGDQVELELLALADDRVAGVVAALEADDHLARSASRSVIFPLPSSPHWAPTMTTPGISAGL